MSKHLKKNAGRHVLSTLIALLILALVCGVVYYALLRPGSPIMARWAKDTATDQPVEIRTAEPTDAQPTPTPEPPSTVPDTEAPAGEPEEPTGGTEGEEESAHQTEKTGSLSPMVTVTQAPLPADEPAATDEPAITDEPAATEESADAQAAAVTDEPAATEVAAVQVVLEATPEPTPEPEAAEPTPEPVPVDLRYPYYIEVDRGQQVVRVYTVGPDGTYSILARTMICSTDLYGNKPPMGLYRMDGEKLRWMGTVSDTAAQYGTRISSRILFHSITYSMWYANTIEKDAYRALGTNASAGCVRLCCADAKWIYDNVPAGTAVRFMSSARDEELLQQLAVPPLGKSGYDPTDEREENPDFDPSYAESKPEVTPYPGVTPAPTDDWQFDTYVSPGAIS